MKDTRLRLGDRVRFSMGGRPRDGWVREDRGAIGINGRRLYRVEFRAEAGSPSHVELPADELTPVGSGRAIGARPT